MSFCRVALWTATTAADWAEHRRQAMSEVHAVRLVRGVAAEDYGLPAWLSPWPENDGPPERDGEDGEEAEDGDDPDDDFDA